MVLKINGDIVGNDWKEIYDWFGIECSTPGDVQKALAELPKGDRLQVKINSGGGEVMAGQEMYSMLRNRNDVDIEVESMAASAASVIAMAGHSTISPVGMLMIHCVSAGCVSGNHQDMEKMAETLRTYVYGDNVIEKHGINRDRTGDREKIRYLCGKQGIFTRDRALIRPGSIRQLETRASTRSASFFHALGGPTTAAALLGHIVPTTGRNP